MLAPESNDLEETNQKELTYLSENTFLKMPISEPHQCESDNSSFTSASTDSSCFVSVSGNNISNESQFSNVSSTESHLHYGSDNANVTDPSIASSGFVIVSGNNMNGKRQSLHRHGSDNSNVTNASTVSSGEVTTGHKLVSQSRFVLADTILPPDSDAVAGVHVWEQACIPCGKDKIIPTDFETIQAKLQQHDGDANLETQIIGQLLYQMSHEWGIKNVASLLCCDSAKIRCLVVDTIEDICYRHNPSKINPEHFLEAAEVIFASIIRHIGDETSVSQLSYILQLSLSTVYLQTIARQNFSPDILGEKLLKYHSQLSKLNRMQHISVRYFIDFLQYFLTCLVANVKNLYTGHWLQVENWDEILRPSHSKAEDIRRMSAKCNLCDRISVLVLLLNVINRLDDTELPLKLLMKLVKQALDTTAWIIKNRKSRSKQHAIALLISRGCRYILENKPLIEAGDKDDLREKIREILLTALDTKDHTKHMVSEELKCLAFFKTSDIRTLIAEKIVKEGQFTDVCFNFICHKLKRTKVSLHCNSNKHNRHLATCTGKLGSMRVKTVCFIGSGDGINSRSSRTIEPNTKYGKKEDIDYVDNTLSTLVSLQRKDVHSNIVQLIAYHWQAYPKFFVVEEPNGVNLQEYLLLKRYHRYWLNDLKLIFIVKQALCAVQHLHDRYILHRDFTSHRFKICPETLTLKLVDFRIAKKTKKQDVITCLNEETKLAVRWTATESQVSDKFSFLSDVWMFGHFMLETWTHGCWPYSEHHDKTTDSIMEMVVRGGMKPKQPRCVPNNVFDLMLQTWETEDKRISTKQLMRCLDNLFEQYSEKTGVRYLGTKAIDEHYPPILKQQLERNHEPEYGVQRTVLSIKITKQRHYYNDELYRGSTYIMIQNTDLMSDNDAYIQEDTQGTCKVSETLLMTQTDLRLQELENLSGAIKLELNYDNDMHRELVFQYPKGSKMRDIAMKTTDIISLLRVLGNTAKLISKFHNAGWILRSICTFDLWVAEEDKRVYPLRLSRCCAFPTSEDWVIDNIFKDRQNWLPIETLRDKEYTKEGDVYQFAMTVVEVFNILDLSGPEKHSLSSIPFAYINGKEELEITLLRGDLPKFPTRCPGTLLEILKRCMSREKIRRPKIEDILTCIENCYLKISLEQENEEAVYDVIPEESSLDEASCLEIKFENDELYGCSPDGLYYFGPEEDELIV
ncbi:hypothetical protein CHS0354_011022 [Potamilus streckersoni]|uniref:Protein kinase domain-containing protein n=1 Tax=Potamilus streckersoni TaxID=2493646 RepID=A0AAE0TM31_9BIVA|nr:hypothetical protein CHS0354_011022 [Potamilus streckersoni]